MNYKLVKIITLLMLFCLFSVFIILIRTTNAPAKTLRPPVISPIVKSVGWKGSGLKKLNIYKGPLTITKSGTKIDGVTINGPLLVEASNVTITRSLIVSPTTFYAVRQWSQFKNLTLSYVEITALKGASPDQAFLGGSSPKLDHVYIHGTQRGVVATNGLVITNSYIDNFVNRSSNHAQAILSLGNIKNVTLYNNVLGCHTGNCTAALSLFPEQGANVNWKITYNKFRGGSYCVYLGNSGIEKPNIKIDFENNKFDTLYSINCGDYGPVASWSQDPSNVWKNNVWYAPCNIKDGRIILPKKP